MNPKIVSGVMLVICAVGIWQVSIIPESTIYSEVGPILAPMALITILTLLVLIYTVQSFRRQHHSLLNQSADNTPDTSGDSPLPGSRQRIMYFILAGCVFVLCIKPLGFLAPATLCGVGIAKSFDAPLNLKTVLICMLIALSFWGLFNVLLGVDLGPLLRHPF